MLRYLQTIGSKPIKATYVASAAMKQGMAVSLDTANGEIDIATGVGDYLVDVPKSYTGLNAIVNPVDDAFEDIALGQKALVIPTFLGERYATDQITSAGLDVGDPLDVANGLFIKATTSDAYQWVYGGAHSDPTGTLHIVERVAKATV